jgi:hypothetical protein
MNYEQVDINARDISAPMAAIPPAHALARPGSVEGKARLREQEVRAKRAIAANERRRHQQNALTGEFFIIACLVMTGVALLLSLWIGGSFLPAHAYLF